MPRIVDHPAPRSPISLVNDPSPNRTEGSFNHYRLLPATVCFADLMFDQMINGKGNLLPDHFHFLSDDHLLFGKLSRLIKCTRSFNLHNIAHSAVQGQVKTWWSSSTDEVCLSNGCTSNFTSSVTPTIVQLWCSVVTLPQLTGSHFMCRGSTACRLPGCHGDHGDLPGVDINFTASVCTF